MGYKDYPNRVLLLESYSLSSQLQQHKAHLTDIYTHLQWQKETLAYEKL